MTCPTCGHDPLAVDDAALGESIEQAAEVHEAAETERAEIAAEAAVEIAATDAAARVEIAEAQAEAAVEIAEAQAEQTEVVAEAAVEVAEAEAAEAEALADAAEALVEAEGQADDEAGEGGPDEDGVTAVDVPPQPDDEPAAEGAQRSNRNDGRRVSRFRRRRR